MSAERRQHLAIFSGLIVVKSPFSSLKLGWFSLLNINDAPLLGNGFTIL